MAENTPENNQINNILRLNKLKGSDLLKLAQTHLIKEEIEGKK